MPGEAAPGAAKALHLHREQERGNVPGEGTAAERSLADCSFVWAKTGPGSATGNKKAGGGAVKIPAISQPGPRLPSPPFPFPPAGSGGANKGFQASLGKRQEEAEVGDGRGSGAAPAGGDPGPAARSEPQGVPGGKRPRSDAGRAGTRGRAADLGGALPPPPAPRRNPPPPPDIPFGFDLQPGRGRGTPFPQCSGACRRRRLRCR